jgi:hypothetical protein
MPFSIRTISHFKLSNVYYNLSSRLACAVKLQQWMNEMIVTIPRFIVDTPNDLANPENTAVGGGDSEARISKY